ncbi:hypothetical protein DO97_02390 [Neosynechococcus sphagnicola sy1]|uniref:N-acetyltransferase domain-containing protein n=1 Tax=Neosynechococcus sphagnicola sy1 TaxID=1497020 RepID=A0A098TMS7_9CYAN|nr:GNAT family N-acetyltransferase [Neosynechococcus sphagnicola]KGF73177.1 hypothetical protein DO97_02390 [Neosynechococcus sphagnicola sy1]
MSHGFILPPGYTIRSANNQVDRWAVYRLLVLEREEEPSYAKLVMVLLHPYTLGFLILLGLTFLFVAFIFPINHWFYILIFFVLFFLGWVGFFQFGFIYDLFSENERILVIALYQEQVVGSALIASREDYSALLGVYVTPSHRYRGVGSNLIQNILQRGLLPMYVNAPISLQQFYARLGFIRTNVKTGYNMVIQALN